MDKLLYGDFEEQYTDYETAEIAILPVPYDGTSTWLKGADKGPRAILEASPGVIGWGTLGQYRCFQGYSQIL